MTLRTKKLYFSLIRHSNINQEFNTDAIPEAVYEHLKTRRKYNTLQLKYDVKCDELEKKVLELNVEKKVRLKQQDLFNERLQELIEENLKLKEDVTKLKKELREMKKSAK